MKSMILKTYNSLYWDTYLPFRTRLREWKHGITHYDSYFFGLVFDIFNRTYKTTGNEYYFPKDLTTRGFRTRFYFDTYEYEEKILLKEYLPRDAKVIELGGCMGVVSCITNKMLNNPKQHLVVEANPMMIPWIEKNRAHNNCEFIIENCVVSDEKEVTFYIHDLIIGGSAHRKTEKTISAKGKTINDIEAEHNIQFDTLIMDIEGGEVPFFKENREFLKRLKTIFVEIHGFLPKEDQELCKQILREEGFTNKEIVNGSYLWVKD